MIFGPPLSDGTPTLVLISDNNFNPLQSNQILAFALRSAPVSIDAIQGPGHHSPFDGDWVRGVEGVVTAVDPKSGGGGFWLQGTNEDDDDATSSGIYVHREAALPNVGDRVRIDGGVREIAFRGALGVTRIEAGTVEVLASGTALPEPVVIGRGGRRPPTTVIDDDRMQEFDPCCDGIDFYEALEGMRVRIEQGVVIAGTSRFGEIVVLADRGADASLRTPAGGLVLRPGDFNPERILLDDQLVDSAPELMVSDALRDPVDGILDYSFGSFKVLVEHFPAAARLQIEPPPFAARQPPAEELTVATYNVLNLDPGDGEEQYQRLAKSIVGSLDSPDILGLQEIQDDNGGADDGVVSADNNLEMLTQAIRAAGGPDYLVRQINPAHNADGGQPNANIRVVWLLRADRVQPVDRDQAKGSGVTVANLAGQGPVLLPSPGRVAPESAAFAGDTARNWEGSRKCLALEALFREQPLFLINCHLKSKRGDDALFGARQPPVFATEEQRAAQAREVRALVEQVLDADPTAHVIVLGDANENDFAAPMRELSGAVLTNLIERVPRPERYSFNFKGNSGVLDHILVSPALAAQTVDVSIHHINTHLPSAWAVSDHDPVSARFRFGD
jgi:predicted extracellular nuclease